MYTVNRIPKIRIDSRSLVPAYRQIADSLRVHLVAGTVEAGTPLPSVRRLAMELGVHFNTVGEAYRVLAAEGWIDLHHGRGATVIERHVPTAKRDQIIEFRLRLRHLLAQMAAAGIPYDQIEIEMRAAAEGL